MQSQLTYEDVYRVAFRLRFEENQHPSVRLVMKELGGSPNTITKHLDQFWLDIGKSQTPRSSLMDGLPVQLIEALRSLYDQALTGAKSEAERQLAPQLAAAEETVRMAESAKEAADRNALALSTLLTETRQAVDRLRNAESHLQAEVGSLKTQLKAHEEEVISLRQSVHVRDAMLEEVRSTSAAAVAAANARADDTTRRLMLDVDARRQETADAERRAQKAQEALATARANFDKQVAEYSANAEAASRREAEKTREIARMSATLQSLQIAFADAQTSLTSHRRTNATRRVIRRRP